jgi:hypothetical protein
MSEYQVSSSAGALESGDIVAVPISGDLHRGGIAKPSHDDIDECGCVRTDDGECGCLRPDIKTE